MNTIKICKLWGVNNLGINLEYPCEIIENHPVNEPLPEGFLILSDKEIEEKINAHREEVEKIFEKQNRPRKWILTGEYEDPTSLDFNILPLSSKKLFDTKNNKLIGLEHYKNFNLESFEFSDLAIKEGFENFYDKEDENKIIAQKVTMTWYKERFEDEKEDYIGAEKIFINTLDIRL